MKKSLAFVTIVAFIAGGLYWALPIKPTPIIAQEYYPDISIPDEDAPVVVEETDSADNTILSLTTPPPIPKKREWYSLDGWSGGAKWKENDKAVIIKKTYKLPLNSKRKKTQPKRRYLFCPLLGI